MDIHRDHVLLPITSAQVVHIGSDRILLAGEGPFVKLFSLTSSSLLRVIQAFKAQAIHGISHSVLTSSHAEKNVLLALWGGRSLALVRLRIRQDSDKVYVETAIVEGKRQLDDWILDAKFLNDSQGSVSGLVLLDAQNNLFSLQFPGNAVAWRPHLLAQGPPSALYCGDIHFSDSLNILIAVGTVFGGVYLWSIRLPGDNAPSDRITTIYAGHEGSVFDVSLAKFQAHDGLHLVILTCSDDRTIKVWNAGNELQKSRSEVLFHDMDTGFARSKSENPFKSPIAHGTGHISRIWRIKAIPSTGNPLTLASFGEDATVQFWYLQGKIGAESLSLTKGRSTKLHSGKSIWAATVIEDQIADQSRIATGGADGRIVVSNVDSPHSRLIWSSNAPGIEKIIMTETFGSYCWFDPSKLLAVTVTGSIFLGNIEHGYQRSVIRWTLIRKLTELSRHALLAAPSPGHAVMVGPAGHIYLFTLKETKVDLLRQVPCKPSFLSALYSGGKSSTKKINILVANKSSPKLQFGVVDLDHDLNLATGNIFNEIFLTSGFVITTAQYLGPDVLALGSRAGSIAIFRIEDNFTFRLLITIHNVHQRETVTSITAIGGPEWMLTTGRDGYFRVHKIQYCHDAADFSTVHSGTLPFGPDIEGAEIINGKLQIWGFRAQEFVLWNHDLQQELLSIDCGGRHRSWCFFHGTASAIAWTRAGEAHIASLQPNSTLLQQGTHGREIKALAIRPSQDILGRIIATGAEDTCIHISRYNNAGTYQTLEVIRTHITGIQKLSWSHNGRYLFSAAGKEEFFIWQIQSIPILPIGITLLSRCPPVTRTHILRIMDFDFLDDKTILMVYSDSSIRIWNFDFESIKWELLRETMYATCCITQCKILGQHFLTASTDGSLVLWSTDLVQVAKRHIHQSSIKCLEVVIRNDRILIATGGDDGMLAVCVLDTDLLSDVHMTRIWHVLLIPRAHAAAVNALTFISQDMHGQMDLVSVSNDQVVKTWSVSATKEGKDPDRHWHIDIPRRAKHASTVADASCVQTFTEDDVHRIIVAGIGLEFWKDGEGHTLVDEQASMQ